MAIDKARFICHPDFQNAFPVNVFHKQLLGEKCENSDEKFQNRHILFRKKFFIKSLKSAVMKITADDYYKLYINGRFVTQGPSSGYPSLYYYNEIDVTDYLVEGENTVAVHTYYQGLINRVWVSGDSRQMMWFQLENGGETLLVSDESWLCADHTGYTSLGDIGYDTAFLECYDSRSRENKFFEVDFDDSLWCQASVYENADYNLVKQPTEQLSIYNIEPEISRKDRGRLFCDFGREIVGYPSLKAVGKSGDTLIIRCSEELDDEGNVRYEMRCNCEYEEKWILSGNEDELFQFDYKAFRYLEILFPESVEITFVGVKVRHYPYEDKGEYSFFDEKLMKVLDLCKNTVKYGVQEGFLDCPTREKGQYLGDATITARAHVALTGKTELMKKTILDFCESSFICPGVMAVAGSSYMQEIADYSLQLPAQICWVYSVDGDKTFVEKTVPCIEGMVEYFKRYMNKDHLLEKVDEKWNLVDWPHNLRDGYSFPLEQPIGEGIHNVINGFWCGFLQSVDELYSIVGKPPTGLCSRAKESFVKAFYDDAEGLFFDDLSRSHKAIHSNILPLLFDIGINEKSKESIIRMLSCKGLSSMGVYMAYFALAALKKQGEMKLVESLATDEKCWINMINEGATTTFEAWGKEQKANTSLCHPWATAPLIIFSNKVREY